MSRSWRVNAARKIDLDEIFASRRNGVKYLKRELGRFEEIRIRVNENASKKITV